MNWLNPKFLTPDPEDEINAKQAEEIRAQGGVVLKIMEIFLNRDPEEYCGDMNAYGFQAEKCMKLINEANTSSLTVDQMKEILRIVFNHRGSLEEGDFLDQLANEVLHCLPKK